MIKLSIVNYKEVGGVFLVKKLPTLYILLGFLCFFSSCSKDEEQTKDYMTQLYEESQTLQYQSADSIETFTQKFYGYLEYNPDAYNHPYYSSIDEKIYENSPKCFVLDTDWDEEDIISLYDTHT